MNALDARTERIARMKRLFEELPDQTMLLLMLIEEVDRLGIRVTDIEVRLDEIDAESTLKESVELYKM